MTVPIEVLIALMLFRVNYAGMEKLTSINQSEVLFSGRPWFGF